MEPDEVGLPEVLLDLVALYLYPVEIARMSLVLGYKLAALNLYKSDGKLIPTHADRKLADMRSQIKSGKLFFETTVDELGTKLVEQKISETFRDSSIRLNLTDIPLHTRHLLLEKSTEYMHMDYQPALRKIELLTLDNCRLRRLDPKLEFPNLNTIIIIENNDAPKLITSRLDKFWTNFKNVRKIVLIHEFAIHNSGTPMLADFITDLVIIYRGQPQIFFGDRCMLPASLKRLKLVISDFTTIYWLSDITLDELEIECGLEELKILGFYQGGESILRNIRKFKLVILFSKFDMTDIKLEFGNNCNVEVFELEIRHIDKKTNIESRHDKIPRVRKLPDMPKLRDLVVSRHCPILFNTKIRRLYFKGDKLPTLPESLEELHFGGSISNITKFLAEYPNLKIFSFIGQPFEPKKKNLYLFNNMGV